MNFLNLEYFVAAAEELNFTRAAKRLFISQQSLSSHIQKLEEYYQVQLFDRTPPLTLTTAGKCLFEKARDLLHIKDQTDREMRDIKDFRQGDITFGVTHSRGRVILPRILPAYHRNFANIQLHLLEGTSEELEEFLHAGKADLIIGFLPRDRANVESVPLFEEDILAIVPKSVLKAAFSDAAESVAEQLRQGEGLALLRNCPFVLMDPATKAGRFAQMIFEQNHIQPNIVLQTHNVETMLALSLKGLGIAFCPEGFITLSDFPRPEALENALICPLRIPSARMVIAVSYLKHKYVTQAARKFIQIAQEALHPSPFHSGRGGD